MVLSVRDVSKCYQSVTILDGVSLDVSPGEVVALTGESGSGKSTLLHIVAGLEPFDSGHVRVDGADISGMSDAKRADIRRHKIGIIFQQFNLIPSLSVGENISFQARLAGRSTESASDLSQTLGLSDHLKKYPEELSGGQQQRVAIARAVLPRPNLILADEPTGNLDETTGDDVFDLLVEQSRHAGSALLIATHSTRLAARADRRLHLQHGLLSR